jgi:hypothetical protein
MVGARFLTIVAARVHLLPDAEPVRRDRFLRVVEGHRARADLLMQVVFDVILLMKSWLRVRRLRPKVFDRAIAAEL